MTRDCGSAVRERPAPVADRLGVTTVDVVRGRRVSETVRAASASAVALYFAFS